MKDALHFIGYLGLRITIGLANIAPTLMLEKVVRSVLKFLNYRSSVILSNLSESMPNLSGKEKEKIKSEFYNNMATVVVSQLKGAQIGDYRYSNTSLIHELAKKHGAVLLLGSHFGCWEASGKHITPLLQGLDQYVVFKRLNNPYVDKYIKQKRSNTPADVIEMKEMKSSLERALDKKNPSAYYLIADQYTPNKKHHYNTSFMGIETRWVSGPQYFAESKQIPVVYMDIQKLLDHTSIDIKKVYDPKDESCNDASNVTAKYSQLLEEQITRQPSYWLWSHKRWKNLDIYR